MSGGEVDTGAGAGAAVRSAAPGAPFCVDVSRLPDGTRRVLFSGDLRFQACYQSWREVRELVADARAGVVELDLSGVEGLDGGSAALLVELLSDLHARGARGGITGAQDEVEGLLALYGHHPQRPSVKDPPGKRDAFEQIGRTLFDLAAQFRDAADFIGQFVLQTRAAVRHPGAIPWRTVMRLAERHGADAVAIVAIINLLVGVILAFQAAAQLERFGAEVFVADLVGLSVVRELGPLMTAILVAGRSGAAFAAELGTMKVSEEVDALKTLGLSPTAFLVLPRSLALLLVLPLLTIIADVFGVAGGLLIGVGLLDLTVVGYWNQTVGAIGGADLGTGLAKSFVFAVTVAMISCQRGLATRGGAEGVGRSTTSAVVTCIFHLVLLDAAMTWVFSIYGM
ncbi:MAG: MlaE family lipid ABC transporter permease subunit [Planctomycetota bacterium]